MTKEEAYIIFVDELVKGNEELKVLVEKNVMFPIVFNSAWSMASENQETITKQEMIERACVWMKRELAAPMPDELYEQWCNEKIVDFRNEMKG